MKRMLFLIIQFLFISAAFAQYRFPKPEFTNGYKIPSPTEPPVHLSLIYDCLSVTTVVILFLIMVAGCWFLYNKRSRIAIFILIVFSLIVLGFLRGGCLCPVGSIQNVAAALFNSSYPIGWFGLTIFLLPILFALFAGRIFCGTACPLGAIQEVINVFPLRLPVWLDRVLRLVPLFYLALAVFFAAMGIGFIVCQFDPFVGFFRLTGTVPMLIAGTLFLLIGIFVCRPYCRFLCPYGVLQGWASMLSSSKVRMTPDDCIKCRLCETACPVDAIVFPNVHGQGEPLQKSIRRGLRLMVILPLVIIITALTGWAIGPELAKLHPEVQLFKQVNYELNNGIRPQNNASLAFRSSDISIEILRSKNNQIIDNSKIAGMFLGIFLGVTVMLRLFKYSRTNRQNDYQTDQECCICCGRCYKYCPRERLRVQSLNNNKNDANILK